MIRRYQVYKNNSWVTALLESNQKGFVFTEQKTHDLIDAKRVFSVDSESFDTKGKLTTVLGQLAYHDETKVFEADSREVLPQILDSWLDRYGEPIERESRVAQRPQPNRRRRPGRRRTIEPTVAVWFNLDYDLGRLVSHDMNMLRVILTGADSYRIQVTDDLEIEVARMILGASASNFEWFVRRRSTKTVCRVIGIDMTGYWKTSLEKAAASLGITPKVSLKEAFGVSPEEFFRRARESFTETEWAFFRDEYGIGDVKTTLELYHRTVSLLTQIDARVVRRTGIIPPSAPGAAARIMFQRAFDAHPSLRKANGGPGSWERPPQWVDQMGLDAYFGGRAFCSRPGVHSGMISLDIKSAYPHAMACLPDPVTAVYRYVDEQPFVLDHWIGQFGVLVVDACELDSVYPSLRTHDEQNGRLRYLAGELHEVTATIPEIVIGVASGTLRVTRIHRGVWIQGNSKTSFMRQAIGDFFRIKNDPTNEPALQAMGKLMANSSYGKLIEVNCANWTILDSYLINHYSPRTDRRIAETMIRVYAGHPDTLPDDAFCGDTPVEMNTVRDAYRLVFRHCLMSGDERPIAAATAYTEALKLLAEEPKAEVWTIGELVKHHATYKCGQYFMPIYASQITGLTSAKVALLSRCLSAYQGDTDSVHIPCPEGVNPRKDAPASELGLAEFRHYENIMRLAGYATRIDECPGLGDWFCETDAPSDESVLVRPKVYSHKFGETYKQAKHAISKWPTDKAGLHKFQKQLVENGSATYTQKPSPRKLKAAVRSGETVGEFISSFVLIRVVSDPNVYTDENGIVNWKPVL